MIADGPLLRLSFGALREPGGRYLLERYEVHYAPAVVPAAAEAAPPHGTGPMLLVGRPRRIRGPTRTRSCRHFRAAAARSSTSRPCSASGTIRVLRGPTRREAGVRGLTGRFGRCTSPHTAWCATTPRSTPSWPWRRAAVALRDDGRLTMAEVYDLDLRTDLVFLSACRTARGGVSADGVLGFTRAFFHAGASSVVAHSVDVVDEPSQRLALDFYRARLPVPTTRRPCARPSSRCCATCVGGA